jgi:hypothetical protein
MCSWGRPPTQKGLKFHAIGLKENWVASRCKAALRGNDRGLDKWQRWGWDPTSAPLYSPIRRREGEREREREREGGGDNRGRVCVATVSPSVRASFRPSKRALLLSLSARRVRPPLSLLALTNESHFPFSSLHLLTEMLPSWLHFTSLHFTQSVVLLTAGRVDRDLSGLVVSWSRWVGGEHFWSGE